MQSCWKGQRARSSLRRCCQGAQFRKSDHVVRVCFMCKGWPSLGHRLLGRPVHAVPMHAPQRCATVCYFVSRWSQAAVQQCEDGEAPADEGKDTSASGAGVPGSHGVHIDATAGSNAHLTAELAAAAPYELPGEAARPFFDPGFSPVAESFDVNPEANDGLRKLPLDRYTAQSGLGRPYPTAAAGPAAATTHAWPRCAP